MSSREEVEKATRAKADRFAAVFGSPEGQRVLKELEQEFDGDELRGVAPHDTYFKIGQRDVVVYIKQMIRYSERNDES